MHVQAIVEVLAEAALLRQRLEVLVGGGQDAHVDGLALQRTKGQELPLLHHPQQLGLHLQGHGADLVEQDRAAVGGLQQAGLDRPWRR